MKKPLTKAEVLERLQAIGDSAYTADACAIMIAIAAVYLLTDADVRALNASVMAALDRDVERLTTPRRHGPVVFAK